MEEIELYLTQEDLRTIVDCVTLNFSKESKSYVVGDNLFEELGRAMFNEYIVNAVEQAVKNI